jgi:transposase
VDAVPCPVFGRPDRSRICTSHINGIENFWNQAKRHLRRFNGIPAAHFPLFLKECEWRFNTPQAKQQQTQLIQWTKQSLQ